MKYNAFNLYDVQGKSNKFHEFILNLPQLSLVTYVIQCANNELQHLERIVSLNQSLLTWDPWAINASQKYNLLLKCDFAFWGGEDSSFLPDGQKDLWFSLNYELKMEELRIYSGECFLKMLIWKNEEKHILRILTSKVLCIGDLKCTII